MVLGVWIVAVLDTLHVLRENAWSMIGQHIEGLICRITCHLLQRELLDPCRRIRIGGSKDKYMRNTQ